MKEGNRDKPGMHIHEPGVWRDRITVVLLVIAALGAVAGCALTLLSSGMSIPALWQATAYLVFAGLFLLLATAPREYPGVWELCILQNAVMAGAAAVAGAPAGAAWVLPVDGALFLLLLAGYLLAKGYTAWGRFRHL